MAGKGGVGKTALAGLIVRSLREMGLGPVLAIDADPSANLNSVLGLELRGTLGEVRDELLSPTSEVGRSTGVPKRDYLEYRLSDVLVESDGVDLLAMGHPEGPGCYCAANNLLRAALDKLAASYRFIVIDNEAGLEHLSRQLTRDVDVLLVVADGSVRSLETAKRIVALARQLDSRVAKTMLVLNRVDGRVNWGQSLPGRKIGVDLTYTIARDLLVEEYDLTGQPLAALPAASGMVQAVRQLVEDIVGAEGRV